MHACTRVYTHAEVREPSRVSFFGKSTCFILGQGLSVRLGFLAESPKGSHLPPPLQCSFRKRMLSHSFLHGSWGANSGSHAYKAMSALKLTFKLMNKFELEYAVNITLSKSNLPSGS